MKRNWYKGNDCAYFITNTVCEWKNLFIFDQYIHLILDSWGHFQKKRGTDFYGFVIMPSHLHYVIRTNTEDYGIIEMQRDFKKFTAKRIIEMLNDEIRNGSFDKNNLFQRLNILRETARVLLDLFKKIGQYNRQNYKIWLPEDEPEAIISPDFIRQKLNYIHNNPVTKGFVTHPEEYPFSSARNYILDDDSLLEIKKNDPI
jgi:putative transposase